MVSLISDSLYILIFFNEYLNQLLLYRWDILDSLSVINLSKACSLGTMRFFSKVGNSVLYLLAGFALQEFLLWISQGSSISLLLQWKTL